jgi:hypothetical protein
MNPPFSNPTPFVKKFVEHNQRHCPFANLKWRWLQYLWESNVSWAAMDYLRFYNGQR